MSQHTPASHPPLSLNLGPCSSPGVGGGESQKTTGQTVPTLMLYTVHPKGMAPASLCLCNALPHGKMGLQEACHASHQRGGVAAKISTGRQLFSPRARYHAAFDVHKYDSETIRDLDDQRIVEANSTVLMKTHFRTRL